MNLDDLRPEAILPKGVKDFLPAKAAKIQFLERTLTDIFKCWGFRPVVPASLEYVDVLEKGLGRDLQSRVFRTEDRQTNRIASFSPDITPQIARIVATRMHQLPLPLRLCYSGRVLRHTEVQAGKDREIFQTGVELIGLEGPEADAEMIAMTVECLRAVGAEDFTVDIGRIDFFRGLMDELPVDAAQRRRIEETIRRKESSELARLLEGIDAPRQILDGILALPRLFGGPEVLERAETIACTDRCRQALANLRRVLDVLAVYEVLDRITIDLGEISSLDYHTGITFRAYLTGIGRAVCSGGRYDTLTERYGYKAPATGFTFNLLGLLFALDTPLEALAHEGSDVLVFQRGSNKERAQRVAIALRRQGYSAARDIFPRELDASIDYARKMHFTHLIEIGTGNEATLHRVADGEQTFCSLEQIFSGDFDLAYKGDA